VVVVMMIVVGMVVVVMVVGEDILSRGRTYQVQLPWTR
jgi:hypothetical protein